jgi:serine/threonine-protein kinase
MLEPLTESLAEKRRANLQESLAARHPHAPLPGYETMGLLGEGTWCRVYLARQTGAPFLQPPNFAVKVLRPDRESDPRGLVQLCREARIGRAVNDRHLVPILHAQLQEAPYFVVMPYLRGMTVQGRLSSGMVALSSALWWVRQTAQALAAMHEKGWLHGDVKPDNILVSPSGHATLLDYGLSRKKEELPRESELDFRGTLNYLAPEQWRSVTAADERSDLYSLGVVLFELLTGRRPLGDAEVAMWTPHQDEGDRSDVRILNPRIPIKVTRLIRQLLAQQPLRRPQTASEVVERLIELEVSAFANRTQQSA